MNTVLNGNYEVGHYFLEEINNVQGIMVSRIIIILVAAFVVGFYFYIKNEK